MGQAAKLSSPSVPVEGCTHCGPPGHAHTQQHGQHPGSCRVQQKEGPTAQGLACGLVMHGDREAACTAWEAGEAQASHRLRVSPEALLLPPTCALQRPEEAGKRKLNQRENSLNLECPAPPSCRWWQRQKRTLVGLRWWSTGSAWQLACIQTAWLWKTQALKNENKIEKTN